MDKRCQVSRVVKPRRGYRNHTSRYYVPWHLANDGMHGIMGCVDENWMEKSKQFQRYPPTLPCTVSPRTRNVSILKLASIRSLPVRGYRTTSGLSQTEGSAIFALYSRSFALQLIQLKSFSIHLSCTLAFSLSGSPPPIRKRRA